MRWPSIRLLVIGCAGAAACAQFPAGEDPRGLRLKAEASQVLVAVRSFAGRHRYYPRTAAEMVPEFLPAAPEVQLRISPSYAYGLAFFEYDLPWPSDRVSCASPIEVTRWSCHEYK